MSVPSPDKDEAAFGSSSFASPATPSSASAASTYLAAFSRGVLDSLQIPAFLSYCLRSEGVWVPTARCMAMNVTLLITFALFARITAGTGLEWVVVVSWQIPLRLTTDVFGFYGWSLYPSMFYAAQNEKYIRRKTTPRRIVHSSAYVGEKALRTVMQLAATLLKVAIGAMPGLLLTAGRLIAGPDAPGATAASTIVNVVDVVVAGTACFLLDALVYSFFCFECRLEQQGLLDRHAGVVKAFRLSELLGLFESSWVYYLGYGTVQHMAQKVLVWYGHPLLASCFYAAIMPINVVTALDASPGPRVEKRLPLFSTICLHLGRKLSNLTRTASSSAAVPSASDGAEPSSK